MRIYRIYRMRDLFANEVANLTVVNCLNQDFQDFRIYRMRDLFANEVVNLTVINCLNQDFQDFRIYRMRICLQMRLLI
jgi:hypothetical protein